MKSVTLIDLKWRNGSYFALLHWRCLDFKAICAALVGSQSTVSAMNENVVQNNLVFWQYMIYDDIRRDYGERERYREAPRGEKG